MNQYGMNLEPPNNLHSGSEGICFKEFDAELLSNTQAILHLTIAIYSIQSVFNY